MMQNKNISVVAYVNGWTLWVYKDPEINVAEMEKIGFFDGIKNLMDIGDIFYLVGKDGVKQVRVKTLTPVVLEKLGVNK